ncbi:squalene/phytoene synthase family protein [Arenibaculum pallidiluteum]|uniref:squalene/phytoene synthase family protein n=1 Tax=Arenibaculum pallidiluteum TaxID=2812559 RepID=UPI001A96DF08|nr:squalene/phytoene synthase family protein [Arenibaculum pallidiluteum]
MADHRTIQPSLSPEEPTARKTSAEENFPVASRLVSARLRPHVMAFYRFVRLADDIADDPDLEPEAKLGHLNALDKALTTGEAPTPYLAPALALRASLAATGVSPAYARQLIQAFRRDARNERCANWGDLLLYCRYSAVPVGRYLLALHGEGQRPVPASDALCAALQIINHVQDVREDWVRLGRCYVPLSWFEQARLSPERLVETRSDMRMRAVLDRVLDQVDGLLARADALPRLIEDRRLRLEASITLALAKALARRLRRDDPLARKVTLSTLGRAGAALSGLARGLAAR